MTAIASVQFDNLWLDVIRTTHAIFRSVIRTFFNRLLLLMYDIATAEIPRA